MKDSNLSEAEAFDTLFNQDYFPVSPLTGYPKYSFNITDLKFSWIRVLKACEEIKNLYLDKEPDDQNNTRLKRVFLHAAAALLQNENDQLALINGALENGLELKIFEDIFTEVINQNNGYEHNSKAILIRNFKCLIISAVYHEDSNSTEMIFVVNPNIKKSVETTYIAYIVQILDRVCFDIISNASK